MKRTGKRMLSWLLSIVMVLTLVPATAFAAEVEETTTTPNNVQPDADNGYVWVLTDKTEPSSIGMGTACARGFNYEHTHDEDCYSTVPCGHIHDTSCYTDESECSGKMQTGTGVFGLPTYGDCTNHKYHWSEGKLLEGTLKSYGANTMDCSHPHTASCFVANGDTTSCRLATGGNIWDSTGTYVAHTHVETDSFDTSCYVYTWTLYADVNDNGEADVNEKYTVIYTDGVNEVVVFEDQKTTDLAHSAETPVAPDTTRQYYTFEGWSPEWTETVKTPTTKGSTTITYTATWTPINDVNENDIADEEEKYTVIYTDGVNDVEVFADQKFTDLAHGVDTPAFVGNPVRDNYDFSGWNQVDGTVAEKIATPTTKGSTTITYTAIWTEHGKVTVTFDDGLTAVADPKPQEFYVNGKATKPAEPTWDADHDFLGWYLNGAEFDFETEVNESITLTAKWQDDFNHNDKDDSTEAHYTVTYVDQYNGNTEFANQLVGMPTPTITDPTHEEYTFKGWEPAVAEKVTGEATYTAIWVKDINKNGVKDSDETVSVNVTGNGTVTVNGDTVVDGDKYVYGSTKVETIAVTADAADGSYLVSVKIDGMKTTSVAAKGNHSVEVIFDEMSITAQDGEMNYYVGMPEMSTDALIAAIKTATNEDATPDSIESGIVTEYLARASGPVESLVVTINGQSVDFMEDEWLSIFVPAKLSEQWLPVGEAVEPVNLTFDSMEDAISFLRNFSKNMKYYGSHTFGAFETETVRYSYTAGKETIQAEADVVLKDLRTPTTVTGNDATVAYGAYTVDELKNQIAAAVNVDGAAVTYSLDDARLAALNVGTHKVTLKYAGDTTYKPSEKEITITVTKAPVTISVDNNVVKYGKAYDIKVTTNPDINTIQFVLGLDVAEMHLEGQEPTGWTTKLNLILPGALANLLPESNVTLSELIELFSNDLVKGALTNLGVSEETIDTLVSSMINLQKQFGELEITINGALPTNIGAYVVGAITADANYETEVAVGYLVITPDGYKTELDWIVPDENGIVTLPAIKDGSYDLGAYVTKVYEGTVDEAEKELTNLFLGVDVEGNIVVTEDQNDLTAGAYSEISYILNWGNTMYYAEPIARAFIVVAEPVNIQFVDENGEINGDRLFTFDGEPHALDVKIFDVNNNDITETCTGDLKVTYYGVRSNGEVYNSTTAPTHTGTYTAVATYVEKENGEIIRAGVDVAVMIIKPIADAKVAVDNAHHIYDGKAYDVMQLVTSTPADAKVAVFTCGINLDGDFSEEGLAALDGSANIDFPAAADAVLKQYLPNVYSEGLTVGTVISNIEKVKTALENVGMTSESLKSLTSLLKELPQNMKLTFKDQAEVNPSAVGAYLVVGMIFDPDYVPEFGAGILVITPEVQETYLKFNVEDDNGIFTHKKIANADLGTSAYDDAAFATKNIEAIDLVKSLFVGVDAEGNLVKTTDGSTLKDGMYIQISYIGEINGRYYAQPISRSIIVAMDIADVDILDGTGNENYAQVFTYDGTAKPVTVTVDGKKAPAGLSVMYIGSDTTVDGWYRAEAPTDAGVYTVVAVYTEKDGTKLAKAGGAIGVLIIEPADAQVGLNKAEYVYDGNEHFATLTNGDLDYVTVAIDRDKNIAYVNMPEDTEEHVNRIITMLPAETEARLRTFLEKYENFDGDVQTSVLKEELTLIIDKMVGLDMTAEAEALAKQVADKVIADLEKNEDVNATIQQIKSELAAIEEAVRGEIPNEIEATLEQYIRDVVTVTGGIDIDVDKVKEDIKALITEVEGQLPADMAAELDQLVTDLVAVVKENVDMNDLETEIVQILDDLKVLAADEAKTVAKYVIGAIYSQVDMTEIEAMLEQIVTKVEARGYVDYLKSMVNMIAGVYEGEIDTSAVEKALNDLITKVEEKVASGKIDADDLAGLEIYVDQVLTSLKSVVAKVPDGTVVFGKNPTEVGEYDCYAMNISANYKWEFVEAELVIYETHTVTFVDGNGNTLSTQTVRHGKDAIAPTDPTWVGHTFSGWDKAFNNITTDTVVTALWDTLTYTITFDTDGGIEIAPIKQAYGTAVVAPSNPTKTGYTFDGWDKEIPSTMPAENMTIKALWTINQYTITFDTDGGSVIDPITQDYGTAVVAPSNPTKTGYTFAGWDKEIPGTMPAENMTIKALWTKNSTPVMTYTVSFNANGGTGSMADVTGIVGTYTLPANGFTAPTGKQFKGWATSASGAVITGTTITVNANTTLYAIWETSGSGGTGGGGGSGIGGGGGGTAATKPVNPFTDVDENDYWYNAVLWAVEKGITNGVTPTTFAPAEGCTRGQMVTFLWRSVGSPEPKTTDCPFTDVDKDAYFYNAVLWAVENGVTKGVTETTFEPYTTCSRAHMVTFIFRFAKGTPVGDSNNFIDVPESVYYTDPVQWAVETDVTNGTTETTFSPNNPCTRGQMVTFLYRHFEM